jgi:hypothetical protein
MAVSLPSDLIADVIRNANPARRAAAEARLRTSETDFAAMVTDVGAAAGPSLSGGRGPMISAGVDIPPSARAGAKVEGSSPYQGFERMVLRNLFETLLPAEDSGAFGTGPSAGIWRSMASDQLAGVYAENGGLGIASMLSHGVNGAAPRREAEWPYFAMHTIESFPGRS